MSDSLMSYGTSLGMILGGGIAGTTAVLAGMGPDLPLAFGFGIGGGLGAGVLSGTFADQQRSRKDWVRRTVAFTLFVGVSVGGLLGAVSAWMVDGSLVMGLFAGEAAGGFFGLLLSLLFVLTGRTARRSGSGSPSQTVR